MKNSSGNIAAIWTATTARALGLTSVESLSEEERAQARRLKQAEDRDRFVAARALLRHALSETVDGEIPPGDWAYREGPHGKPVMAPDLPPLEFNLSHAGACVAVSISTSGPVGIDIESAIPDDRLEIVRDMLSTSENAFLDRQPEDRQWETFLEFWTLKEACAKALGLGAMLNFRTLEFDLDAGCAIAPNGLLGPGEDFDIETWMIILDRMPYRLGIAKITDGAGKTEFRHMPL